jgi:hypothetical protein
MHRAHAPVKQESGKSTPVKQPRADAKVPGDYLAVSKADLCRNTEQMSKVFSSAIRYPKTNHNKNINEGEL